jgi:hypothetical protein
MLTHRPRYTSLSNEPEESADSTSSSSSSSSSGLESDDSSSEDEEEYYSYNDPTDKDSDFNEALNSTSSSAPPISTSSTSASKEYPLAARAQAVTLKYLAYPVHQIEKLTRISRSQIFRLYAKVLERR